MKKIGNKVFLMIIIFVLIFGLNTVFSIRMQNSIKQAGLQITKQYIPIQTVFFTMQKSMERGEKYLKIISLYDDGELRQQLESSLAEEISTITASESKMDEYLKNIDNVELKDKIHTYEDFLTEVISQFAIIQAYVDKGDFVQTGIALGVDFQNLMVEMGETTEKELTEELEQGISELSNEYNQSVETNLIMTKIIFSSLYCILFVFASVRFLSLYVDILITALNSNANRLVLAVGILIVCAYSAYKGVFTASRCALIGSVVTAIFIIIFLLGNISDVELSNLYRSNSTDDFFAALFSLLPVCVLPVIFSVISGSFSQSKTA